VSTPSGSGAVQATSIVGIAGDPAGAGSIGATGLLNHVNIGTTPVPIAQIGWVGTTGSQAASVYISNGGALIYLGGSSFVSPSNGVQLAPLTTLTVSLWPGDQLWAATSVGTSNLSVLQTNR
jgi:hypothetical protein